MGNKSYEETRVSLQVAAVEAELAQHLKDVKRKLGCSSISYVSVNKDSHLLDIPDVSTPNLCRSPVSFKLSSSIVCVEVFMDQMPQKMP